MNPLCFNIGSLRTGSQSCPGGTTNANLRFACNAAGYLTNAAGYHIGFEDDDASSVRLNSSGKGIVLYDMPFRSRSRSRRRDRTFRCTDCSEDRAYETERGLKRHKQRYCGKPKEDGVFPCTLCDKVSVTAGLLKMHMGRFHAERSAIQGEERGSGDQGSSNDINNSRSKEDAPNSSWSRGE